MWKIIVLSIILGLIYAQETTPENYKLFSFTPLTDVHLKLVKSLDKLFNGLTFRKRPTTVNMETRVIVAPHALSGFYSIMKHANLSYTLVRNDTDGLIEPNMAHVRSIDEYEFHKSYHSLDEIYENLENLALLYPRNIQTIVAGLTYENREIKGVRLFFKYDNPGIFIEGGMYGSAWISPATIMYILHELLKSDDNDVRELAERHNWYIFPVFNPDGYEYTHDGNRYWWKTRKIYFRPEKINGTYCIGANLDRNWDNIWFLKGIGERDYCTNEYPGTKPFSEIEAWSMSYYISTISNKFYAYISFRGYRQALLYPEARSNDKELKEMDHIAHVAITAIEKRYGTKYHMISTHEKYCTETSSGCTLDYIQKTYGKHMLFEYNMRDTGIHGFAIPPEQIIPNAEETLDSLVAMFKQAQIYGYEHL